MGRRWGNKKTRRILERERMRGRRGTDRKDVRDRECVLNNFHLAHLCWELALLLGSDWGSTVSEVDHSAIT